MQKKALIFLTSILLIFASFGIGYKYGAYTEKERSGYLLQISGPARSVGSDARSSVKKSVYVYVTGEVYHPGVQELAVGERWVTAVGQAEPKRGADLTVINLAAKVQDQQMILVPAVEPVQSGSSGRAGRSRRTGGSNAIMKGPGGSDSVRLNLATAQELDSVLPGIGPELARRIIDYREKHGPFSSVDQLKNVSGIGEKKYGQLKDRVSL